MARAGGCPREDTPMVRCGGWPVEAIKGAEAGKRLRSGREVAFVLQEALDQRLMCSAHQDVPFHHLQNVLGVGPRFRTLNKTSDDADLLIATLLRFSKLLVRRNERMTNGRLGGEGHNHHSGSHSLSATYSRMVNGG